MKYLIPNIFILLMLVSCHYPEQNNNQKPVLITETQETPEEQTLRQRNNFLSNRIYFIHLFSLQGTLVFSSTVRGHVTRINKNWDSDIFWYTENGSYMQWNSGYLITTERLNPDMDPIMLPIVTNDAGTTSRNLRGR